MLCIQPVGYDVIRSYDGGARIERIAPRGGPQIESLKLSWSLNFYKQFHSWRSSGCIVRLFSYVIQVENHIKNNQWRL